VSGVTLAPAPAWTRFLAVGALGFVLQIGALTTLALAGVPTAIATAGAIEIAILHNFLWHERWTWPDRAKGRGAGERGARARFTCFLRFNGAAALVSLVGNVALTVWLVDGLGLPLAVGNAIAVAALAAINFLLADRWVFTSQAEAWDAGGPLAGDNHQDRLREEPNRWPVSPTL